MRDRGLGSEHEGLRFFGIYLGAGDSRDSSSGHKESED